MPFDSAFWSGIVIPAITGFVTSGVVSGAVQLMFKARYDKRLESHKGRLTTETGREIERIRAESTIAAERFKKSYGLLAERQAEAVEAIYGHLVEAHVALLRLVSPGRFGGEPTDPELLQTLHIKRWEGMDYFRAKRLFLPADLGSEIDALYARLVGSEMGSGTTSVAWSGLPETGKSRESCGTRLTGRSLPRYATSKPSSVSSYKAEQFDDLSDVSARIWKN